MVEEKSSDVGWQRTKLAEMARAEFELARVKCATSYGDKALGNEAWRQSLMDICYDTK